MKKYLFFLFIFSPLNLAYSGYEKVIELKKNCLSKLDEGIQILEEYQKRISQEGRSEVGRDIEVTAKKLKEFILDLNKKSEKLKEIDPDFSCKIETVIKEFEEWEESIFILGKERSLGDEEKLVKYFTSEIDEAIEIIEEMKWRESIKGSDDIELIEENEKMTFGMFEELKKLNLSLEEKMKMFKETIPHCSNEIEAAIKKLKELDIIVEHLENEY